MIQKDVGTAIPFSLIYRAYRSPYEWIPQLDKPVETVIEPLDPATFRVPGAAPPGFQDETAVEGAQAFQEVKDNFCVVAEDEISPK